MILNLHILDGVLVRHKQFITIICNNNELFIKHNKALFRGTAKTSVCQFKDSNFDLLNYSSKKTLQSQVRGPSLGLTCWFCEVRIVCIRSF